jgi:hypothetical protein
MIRQLFTVFSLIAAADEALKNVPEPLRPQEPKSIISYDVKYFFALHKVFTLRELANTLFGIQRNNRLGFKKCLKQGKIFC